MSTVLQPTLDDQVYDNASFSGNVFAEYESDLPEWWLRKGIVSYGDTARFRLFMDKLKQGKPVTVVALGGSVTFGSQVANPNENAFFPRISKWIQNHFPNPDHVFLNSAVPGTPSSYMALCMKWHVPGTVDLVFLEYNINDGDESGDVPLRRSHERLLRLLLALPNRPALMEIVVHRWLKDHELLNHRVPYRHAGDAGDDEIGILSNFYHIPWVSMRSLMWDKVFSSNQTDRICWTDFMSDPGHPNARGHHYISDMVILFMRHIAEDVLKNPIGSRNGNLDIMQPLPDPLYPVRNLYSFKSCKCQWFSLACPLLIDSFAYSSYLN